MGRERAEQYEPWEPYEVCISITDPADPAYEYLTRGPADLSDLFLYVCRQEFLDIDDRLIGADVSEETRQKLRERMMTEEQADEIAQLVQYAPSIPVCAIVVHCEAGVSRSVGIARAISEHLGASEASSRAMHGHGNSFVRRRVTEALRRIYGPGDRPENRRMGAG